ncbi:hypothetical protein RQP46_006897 [Phenoliferia psychrophenolica]
MGRSTRGAAERSLPLASLIYTPEMSIHGATGSHLAITADELFHLRLVARGERDADLIIRGGLVVSVHTAEVLQRDVIVSGRHIAAITPWNHFAGGARTEIIQAEGNYVAPGMIDSHIHIEYTKLTPGELARLSVPRGTTTLLADPNCIANVCGVPGMDFMSSTKTPLRILRQVSHKVPNLGEHLELGGKRIETEELARLVQLSSAVSLGESNPFSLDMASAKKQAAALAAGKRVVGHTALLKNEPLWAYAAGGIGDDHNASVPEDMKERMRLGMMMTIMSGSMNSNLHNAFSDLPSITDCLEHFSFCADDKLCEDFDSTGHIDYHVRTAIELGVPPLAAWRMATLNPARDNSPLFANDDIIPAFALHTIHLHPAMDLAPTFSVKVPLELNSTGKAWVQAMEMTLMDVVLATEPAANVRGVSLPFQVCCRCPSHAHDVHRAMDLETFSEL